MKFMLLQNYGGVEADVPPITEWAPDEIEAHINFQKDLNAELTRARRAGRRAGADRAGAGQVRGRRRQARRSSPTAPSRSRRSCSPATG